MEQTAVAPVRARRRNVLSGALFGVGLAGFVDEAVFHQVLHWHHFYDRSTLAVGLVSDGLFHAFSWFATVAGLFLLAALHRQREWWAVAWWAGVLLGAGGFQLYDGIVHHKLLRVHEIRYGVDLLPYDLWWNGVAVAVIVAGLVLLVRTRRRGASDG